MEGLQLRIGADVAQGVQAVKTFNAELSKTATAEKAVSTSVAKVNTSLNSIKPGANQAGNALMNLGRIAQDAPFGFIGISNNISPLLESFQRLKAETGSTSSAFKALIGGLAGGAGLGLAVSVVTGLLTAFGDKLFSSKQKVDELSESQKKYADAQRSTAESIQKQVIEVEALVRIAQSDVSTKQEQANALTKLNEIIPDNIGKLNALNIKTAEGVKIVREYTHALEDQATADLLRGRAAELRVKLFDAESKKSAEVLKQSLFILQQQKRLDDQETNATAQTRASEGFATRQQNIAQSIVGARNVIRQAEKEFVEASGSIQYELGNLRGEIDRNTKGGLKIDIKEPKVQALKKVKVQVEEIELDPAKVGILGGQFSKGIDGMADVSERINTSLAAAFVPLQGTATFPVVDEAQQKLLQMELTANKVSGVLYATLIPAFQQVFEGIITGGGNALQSFGNALKQLVAKIASALITAAAFAAVITLISGGSGAIFMKNFKGIFSSLSGLPKFAEGGIATKATAGIFGERGAEAIIPLKQLPSLLASMLPSGQSGSASFSDGQIVGILRGPNIVLAYERNKNQYGSSLGR